MVDVLSLDGPRVPPAAGGPARHLVVLLHGLGADGNDLIALAPHWSRFLPHAAFVAPHAPFPCELGVGRQWFGLLDRTPAMLAAGIRAVAPVLDAFLDDELAALGLGGDRLALVGFSQGTMMALFLAPRRDAAPAAVLGYSGAVVDADTLATEIRSRPPVMLIHGDADEVVPPESLGAAERALRAAGMDVIAISRPGLGHGIDPEGIERGGRFLARALANSRPGPPPRE